MAKGYWIAHGRCDRSEGYRTNQAANAIAFRKYGARFLVARRRFRAPEGKVRSRHVVIQFTDYATALACYRSPNMRPLGRSGAARARSSRYCGRLRRRAALRLPAASRFGWAISIEQRHFGIDMRAARMSEARRHRPSRSP